MIDVGVNKCYEKRLRSAVAVGQKKSIPNLITKESVDLVRLGNYLSKLLDPLWKDTK